MRLLIHKNDFPILKITFYKFICVRAHLYISMVPSVYPVAITDLALELCFSFPFSSNIVRSALDRYSESRTPRSWVKKNEKEIEKKKRKGNEMRKRV